MAPTTPPRRDSDAKSRSSLDSAPLKHSETPSVEAPVLQANSNAAARPEIPPPGTPRAPEYTDPESTILTGKKLAILFTAMLLNLTTIALDQTILATALPRIASDFQAFTLQGWVSGAFVLGQAAFLLPFSQLLRIYSAKWSLIFFIFFFEIGSAICGAAPNVYVLIFGRALSGAAAAGSFASMMQALAQATRLEDRPRLFGLFGAVFGLSSVIGPLIGGALTDTGPDGWRWCFYINLPVGGIAGVAILFLLKAAPPLGANLNERSPRDLWNQTKRMDWLGLILVLGAVTSLTLALNWGGVTKPWSNYAVIVSLVMAVVGFLALWGWEYYLGPTAMVPRVVFKSLSCVAIVAFNFFIRFNMLIFTYYIPILFQATRNHSATKSGVDILPFMLLLVASVIIGGQIVSRLGRYWFFLVGSPMLLALGAGLMYTVDRSTSTGALAGFQILLGMGVGGCMQNAIIAMQTEFRSDHKHLAQASGMATFGQFLGGTIGLSVAESVFSSSLDSNLRKYAPTANAELIKRTPLAIYTDIPEALREAAITAYTRSLRNVFIIGVPISILAILTALCIHNYSVKPPKKEVDGKEVKKGESTEEAAEKVGAPVAEV